MVNNLALFDSIDDAISRANSTVAVTLLEVETIRVFDNSVKTSLAFVIAGTMDEATTS